MLDGVGGGSGLLCGEDGGGEVEQGRGCGGCADEQGGCGEAQDARCERGLGGWRDEGHDAFLEERSGGAFEESDGGVWGAGAGADELGGESEKSIGVGARRGEGGRGEGVAEHLAGVADTAVEEQRCRVVRDGQRENAEEEVGEDVAALDMGLLVGEHGAELLAGAVGEGGGQEDEGAQDSGYEWGLVC